MVKSGFAGTGLTCSDRYCGDFSWSIFVFKLFILYDLPLQMTQWNANLRKERRALQGDQFHGLLVPGSGVGFIKDDLK